MPKNKKNKKRPRKKLRKGKGLKKKIPMQYMSEMTDPAEKINYQPEKESKIA